jgi:hypothetical protein
MKVPCLTILPEKAVMQCMGYQWRDSAAVVCDQMRARTKAAGSIEAASWEQLKDTR